MLTLKDNQYLVINRVRGKLMSLKVMHFIGHLKTGGAENLITEYALRFDKKKIEIMIVTLSGRLNSFNESRLTENGIKIVWLGDMLLFSKADNILKRVINMVHRHILFLNYVNKERPSIIHSHLSVPKYLIFINNKKLNIRLYYTIHSEVSKLFGRGRFFFKIITKYCIKYKEMIPIALHTRMQKEANEIFKIDKCVVLNNGIDMNRFNPNNYKKDNLRNSLEIQKDAFVIGHVGRFVEAKNHQFLIKVFKTIKVKCPNAIMLLIGTGELEHQIINQVKEEKFDNSIFFLGNRSDIPELMSVMDVFVFPSYTEGFGNVLIEAQAMGLRCVVSNRVPIDAFITNLIIPLELEAPINVWCECILTRNHSEITSDRLKDYDINKVTQKLEDIYLS